MNAVVLNDFGVERAVINPELDIPETLDVNELIAFRGGTCRLNIVILHVKGGRIDAVLLTPGDRLFRPSITSGSGDDDIVPVALDHPSQFNDRLILGEFIAVPKPHLRLMNAQRGVHIKYYALRRCDPVNIFRDSLLSFHTLIIQPPEGLWREEWTVRGLAQGSRDRRL